MGHLLGRNEAGDKALSDALVQQARAFPGVQSRLNAENCVLLYTLLCDFRPLIYCLLFIIFRVGLVLYHQPKNLPHICIREPYTYFRNLLHVI